MGIIALFGTIGILIGLVMYVLLVIAEWKIFQKAGEKWWKCLIPVYNMYILFKISWKTAMFWLFTACLIIAGFCSGKGGFLGILGWVSSAASSVIIIMDMYKLAQSFGHGIGYTLGLIFLPNVFTLILGFGGDSYAGPQ